MKIMMSVASQGYNYGLNEDPLINKRFDSGNSVFAHAAYQYMDSYLGAPWTSWVNDSKVFNDSIRSIKNQYVLYCSTVFDGKETSFILDFSPKDKRMASFWETDDWFFILELCSSKISLLNSLESVEESMRYMKEFINFGKLPSDKRDKVEREIKEVDKILRFALDSANSKANEKMLGL